MADPTRAVASRRYVFTPELLADGRHRYEHTDEPVTSIALDFGVHKSTLTRLAQRENWVRHVRPPRDLPTTTRLKMRVEAVAQAKEQGAEQTATQQSPFVPAPAETQEQDGRAGAVASGSPLARGRTEGNAAPEENAARAPADQPPPSELATQLYREAFAQLGALRALREQLTYQTQSQRDVDKITRALANLTVILRRLLPLQSASPSSGSDYDDTPADIDEFRRRLARRIEAFIASRSDPGDGGEPAADGGAET